MSHRFGPSGPDGHDGIDLRSGKITELRSLDRFILQPMDKTEKILHRCVYLIEIFIHEIKLLIKREHDLALASQFVPNIGFCQT